MLTQAIHTYLQKLQQLYQTGDAREHSYRGHLESLLNAIIDDKSIQVINEPARIRDVGAPDYSISKNTIVLGYIEAKDLGCPDLEGKKENKEQFNRYKKALPNLIITDYVHFLLYQNGELKTKIQLASLENNSIQAKSEGFEVFANSIKSFIGFVSQTITKPSELAKLMAGKARLLESVIENALTRDEQNEADNQLQNQYQVFKSNLIHDLSTQAFADIYAQTIAYGLFAARSRDESLATFSRQEAQYLLPKTNPFLRGLFNYIGGAECDERLVWIIDSLADIFKYADVATILYADKKSQSISQDPVIHFYETFLSEYDPQLRKSRGVWYTPEPVVKFIVRAVDEVLKTEFGLSDGLLDESKVDIQIDNQQAGFTSNGKQRQKTIETHKVQILDPAAGTGTFLTAAIRLMKEQYFGTSWSRYVDEHLIPRLHGFELLMASYAMAHLKLDLLLKETGYKEQDERNQQRFKVYLTNSLEEHHPDTGSLFAQYLANESKEANRIKRDTPVMVVMGNPPYAVSSSNKSKWILSLVQDYKEKLNEGSINSLSNDYVKFIRFGQYHIEKNGEGILAYISSNSFVDGIVHRQMRKSLLETFDKIYIIDLHGNSNKKEMTPDGTKDENVFDIKEGVSINLFIKTNKKKDNCLGEVYHFDLYGKRASKSQFLFENSLNTIAFTQITNKEPYFFFVPKNFEQEKDFQKGFSLANLFLNYSAGTKFRKDNLLIKKHFNKESVMEMISDISKLDKIAILKKYQFNETRDWKISDQKIYFNCADETDIQKVNYRPFDFRFTYYPLEKISKIIVRGDSRKNLMQHFLLGENIGLIFPRLCKGEKGFAHGLVTNKIFDVAAGDAYSGSGTYGAPLYLYPDPSSTNNQRIPNLDNAIVEQIAEKLGFTFTPEKAASTSPKPNNSFAPIDLLDYIYAVLHSPSYRKKYKEFLKIDFPRLPYPNPQNFWQLVELGAELRRIHLLEDSRLDSRSIAVAGEGSDSITNSLNKKDWSLKDGKVSLRINEDIAITNIPLAAWEFYIGGYQPAQKWLKDRIGKSLSRQDFLHYNRIVNALTSTQELMQKIDGLEVGW